MDHHQAAEVWQGSRCACLAQGGQALKVLAEGGTGPPWLLPPFLSSVTLFGALWLQNVFQVSGSQAILS